VSHSKVDARFFSGLKTFADEMQAKGFTPQTVVLALEKHSGPHEANERLCIPLNAPLLHLSRLRSIDGAPLVYVETFLPWQPYEHLMQVDFCTQSLYDSLESLCKVRVTHARREIEAINAPSKIAQLLSIARNKAVSFVKTVAFTSDSTTPVEFSTAWYRGDLNKFSVDVFR
jgi:GntR family transcriptional regulator